MPNEQKFIENGRRYVKEYPTRERALETQYSIIKNTPSLYDDAFWRKIENYSEFKAYFNQVIGIVEKTSKYM